MRWEYKIDKIVYGKDFDNRVNQALAVAGAAGWELVSVTRDKGVETDLYFKRQIK